MLVAKHKRIMKCINYHDASCSNSVFSRDSPETSKTQQRPHVLDLIGERRVRSCISRPEIPPLLEVEAIPEGRDLRRILSQQELQIQKVLAALFASAGKCIKLGIDLEYQSENQDRRA